MESISFTNFLNGYSQNLENESIQLGTADAVEEEKGWDLTNTLETTHVCQLDASWYFFESSKVKKILRGVKQPVIIINQAPAPRTCNK